MIVLDIEASGLFIEKCGIFQIGAIDLSNPDNVFLEECRIDDEDMVTEDAMKVTGRYEEKLRDKNLQSQAQLLENFFNWCKKNKVNYIIGQNPQFDVMFLQIKARKYGLEVPYNYKAFDLHSIAQLRYFQINGKFRIMGNEMLGLADIIDLVGLEDPRMLLKDGKIIKKGNPHNALEDAKIEAECFSRLVFGKNLISEFEEFPIPDFLKE